MAKSEISTEDLESGKVVKTAVGTFYFRSPGRNVDENGWPVWINLHRLDGPAAIMDGTETWYKDGVIHRDGGPACINKYLKVWYKNGIVHREDGPAVIRSDGTQEWRIEGKLHRDKGPALVRHDGSEAWCNNGDLHRNKGPAMTSNRMVSWYIDGTEVKSMTTTDLGVSQKIVGKYRKLVNLLFVKLRKLKYRLIR